MNCEGCPGRGVCDGEPLALATKLMEEHGDLLAMLGAMTEATGAGATSALVLGFTMGYMVRTAEGESSQLDMSVWGECFDAENQT